MTKPICAMCKKEETGDRYCHRCNQSTVYPGRVRCVGYGYVTEEGFERNRKVWEERESLALR